MVSWDITLFWFSHNITLVGLKEQYAGNTLVILRWHPYAIIQEIMIVFILLLHSYQFPQIPMGLGAISFTVYVTVYLTFLYLSHKYGGVAIDY